LNKKNKIPRYLKNLIKDNPKITSGRKNFEQHNYRIIKTKEVIKKYFKLKD
tara:strand:+ start:428 stop:580 length:153 start_codon:yes stop_codon:yes gene_type:complete